MCLGQGRRFQAIDLRWGISEEAELDQRTMQICLSEIEPCCVFCGGSHRISKGINSPSFLGAASGLVVCFVSMIPHGMIDSHMENRIREYARKHEAPQ